MTFQTGKNSQQYLPRESSRQQHGHKDDVCREGLGNTCADDSKLLTEFCLIAHSSKLANPKKEGAKNQKNLSLPCMAGKAMGKKVCIISEAMEIFIHEIYRLADSATL